jgi:hypothetical protein
VFGRSTEGYRRGLRGFVDDGFQDVAGLQRHLEGNSPASPGVFIDRVVRGCYGNYNRALD